MSRNVQSRHEHCRVRGSHRDHCAAVEQDRKIAVDIASTTTSAICQGPVPIVEINKSPMPMPVAVSAIVRRVEERAMPVDGMNSRPTKSEQRIAITHKL